MNKAPLFSLIAGIAALAALGFFASAASGQGGARTGAPSLKAGYAFDPALVPGVVVSTFAVDPTTDVLDVGSMDESRIARRLDLVRNPGPGEDRLRVEIGVSQDPVDPIGAVGGFITDYFFANDAGQQFFASEPSLGSAGRINDLHDTVLFTQSNIYIQIEQISGAPGVALPAAQEIFGQIKSLPPVAALPLPTVGVATFPVPGVVNLTEGQIQAFTISPFDPSGGPLSVTYVAPDGEVDTTGPNPVYRAGSTVGPQTLTVVVSTASLLSGQASLTFNVTP